MVVRAERCMVLLQNIQHGRASSVEQARHGASYCGSLLLSHQQHCGSVCQQCPEASKEPSRYIYGL